MVTVAKRGEAASVAEKALQLCPNSVILWRALIGLGKDRLDVVESARRACPSDPEIWLAFLVIKTREKGAGAWAVDEVAAAIKANMFSVGTLTRAGDFMRRKGMQAAATRCARYATRNCRGLLPAYVLGLRCGLTENDRQWVLLCARDAASNAVEPLPFYRLIGEIEAFGKNTSKDMVGLLEKLRTACPEEPKWALRLGDVYLRRGEGQNAMRVLESVMAGRPENTDLRTLLLAAEAARRAGKLERSIELLERAYAAYPANRVVLNNLVYSLSFDKKTILRAKQLLPGLLSRWGESFAALDTAAMVHLNAGEPAKAKEYLKRALKSVRDIDPAWLERNSAAVDMDAYLGEYNRGLADGLDQRERMWQKTWRDEVLPLASDLSRKVKDAASDK
mgnify:CR=1 FL=1